MIPPSTCRANLPSDLAKLFTGCEYFLKFVIYFCGGLCFNLPMMNDVQETLFKVTLARWSDGTATTTHVLAMDLDHAKRIAWKKWKSVTVEPAPFHTNAKEEFGEFVS